MNSVLETRHLSSEPPEYGPKSTPNPWHWVLAAIVVVLLSTVSYANMLGGEYVFDDGPFLVDNPQLTVLHRPAYFFTGNVWSYALDGDRHSPQRYRPLYFLSLWSIDRVWPGNAAVLHLFSLFLHTTAALLLLIALSRFLPGISPLAAGIGACLFAVHPVNSEAVAWISAFVHPMVTVFLLASYLFHDRYRDSGNLATLLGAVIFFVLALLSNEMAIAFPIFILLYEWVRRGQVRISTAAPYLVVFTIYLLIRSLVLGKTASVELLDYEAWLRFPAFLVDYLRFLVLPWPQPLYLFMPEGWGISLISALTTAVFAGLCAFLALRDKGGRTGILIALAWIVTALIPPLIAVFSTKAVLVMRSLYLPSIGIAILLAWMFHTLPVFRLKIGKAAVIFVLLLGMGTTMAANLKWHNDGHVYRHIVSFNPGQYSGYLGLGKYQLKQGHIQEAIVTYKNSAALAGEKSGIEILVSLGLQLGELGNLVESLEILREVTRRQPGNSVAWNGVGNNLWLLGHLNEAIDAYRNALSADPGNWQACYNLAQVLRQTGSIGEVAQYAECASRPK